MRWKRSSKRTCTKRPEPAADRPGLIQRALTAVGRYWSGSSDISGRHDDYLRQTYADWDEPIGIAVLLLDEQLRIGVVSELPAGSAAVGDLIFKAKPKMEGFFYDWLRDSSDGVIGVRYNQVIWADEKTRLWPGTETETYSEEDNKWLRLAANREYVEAHPGCIEVFFGSERDYVPEKSCDQAFGATAVFESADGALMLAVEIWNIDDSQLPADPSFKLAA